MIPGKQNEWKKDAVKLRKFSERHLFYLLKKGIHIAKKVRKRLQYFLQMKDLISRVKRNEMIEKRKKTGEL